MISKRRPRACSASAGRSGRFAGTILARASSSMLYPAVRQNTAAHCFLGGFRGFYFGSGAVRVHAAGRLAGTVDRLPSQYALENALGIPGGRAVAVVLLDHPYGTSHLFCQEN